MNRILMITTGGTIASIETIGGLNPGLSGEQLIEFLPNIKNNKGETILDRSINGNYIYTTVKILEEFPSK